MWEWALSLSVRDKSCSKRGKTIRVEGNGAYPAVWSSFEKCGQAVVREVKEETGLTVEKPEHIDVVDNIERDENGRVKYHFVIVDYFVKFKGGKLGASSDAAELRWVSLEDVKEYALTRTFREFYKRNCKKLAALESCP